MAFVIVGEESVEHYDARVWEESRPGSNLLTRRNALLGGAAGATLGFLPVLPQAALAQTVAKAGSLGNKAELALLVIQLLQMLYQYGLQHYVVGDNPKSQLDLANRTKELQTKPVIIGTTDATGTIDWEDSEEFPVQPGKVLKVEASAPPQKEAAKKNFGAATNLSEVWKPFKVIKQV